MATAAGGDVTFTGTNGVAIPAGTVLQAADGTLYAVDAEATIASGTATATVTADVVGTTGNQDAGVMLTLVSPIAGVKRLIFSSTCAVYGTPDKSPIDETAAIAPGVVPLIVVARSSSASARSTAV